MEYGDFYRSFDPTPFYKDRGWLIGSGQVGGKAKGLSFAHAVLEKNGLLEEVHLPDQSYVICTSVFNEYMEQNGLWEKLEFLRAYSDAPVLEKLCMDARLPSSLDGPLERILDAIRVPMSVRSSSILEDDVNLSFAGKYATCFIANCGGRAQRRAELENAVKRVYASSYNAAAREYKRKHGIQWGGERMCVLIQPLSGQVRGTLFYPELAGVAFSKVFRRPSPKIRKEDGVARVCFGLGTRTVDRAYARTFYLSNPNLRFEGNSPAQIVTHSQENYDFVDLEEKVFTSAHVGRTVKTVMRNHRGAQAYLQWYDGDMFYGLMANTANMDHPRPVFTFDNLPRRCPDLFQRIQKLLPLFESELRLPADMEFTYETDERRFTLVQLRPLSVYDDRGRVEIPDAPPQKLLLRGDRMVANGRLENVRHLVYVDPELYGKTPDFSEIARAVGELNMKLDGERYILVGPGRWGSSNPVLGVPVRYNELSNAGCLIELGIKNKGMAPELSYGTHFFLDLDCDNILYLPVFDGERNNLYNREWFESHPWTAADHRAVRHYEGRFDVLLDGDSETGVVVDKT